jgi:hypothetical protein
MAGLSVGVHANVGRDTSISHSDSRSQHNPLPAPLSTRREDTYDIRRREHEITQIAHEQALEKMTRAVSAPRAGARERRKPSRPPPSPLLTPHHPHPPPTPHAQAALEARRRERERAQEESLALELERQQREEESRRREIQRICAEDPGLRELQGKLQMAYIAKERGEQLKEREHIVVASKEHERALHEAMMRASAEAEAAQRVREEEEKKRSEERRRTLEAQLEEKQLKVFMESQQEAARERGMVEAILNKIAQEDAQELATKQKNREESIKVIAEFKAQRERAVEAARQAEREEQRRIADYLSNQGAREEAVKKAKAEDAAVRDSQYRAIVAEQEALRKKQEEEDALRWLLVEEEAERRRIEEEERRREKEARSKKEMVSANEHQKMCVKKNRPRTREGEEGGDGEEEGAPAQQPARRGKSSGRPTHFSPPPQSHTFLSPSLPSFPAGSARRSRPRSAPRSSA